MWFIISGDGDIDYTNIYGPFASEKEAEDICNDRLPEDDGGDAYRVVALQSPASLEAFYEN